jgi:glutamate dehydrogenase
MLERLPGTGQEGEAHRLIGAAVAWLGARRPEIPPDFVVQVWHTAPAEDLLQYPRETLGRIAEEIWAALASRTPGRAKIRFDAPVRDPGVAAAYSALTLINDDGPFLFDSILAELAEQGLAVQLAVHPIVNVARDDQGGLTQYAAAPIASGFRRESLIHFHLDPVDDPARRTAVVKALGAMLADVGTAVRDWRPMLARIEASITDLTAYPPNVAAGEVDEAIQFLRWLRDDNFTFLGMRDYALTGPDGSLKPVEGTALGLLAGSDMRPRRSGEMVPITPDNRAFMTGGQLLLVTKANVRSPVHRRVHMDYVAIKRFDTTGTVVGERRIVGLLTSTAYTRSTRSIPFLRRKVDAVLRQAGYDPTGHSGKALVNVLETYPRDELFQIDEETLYRFATAILQLDARPRVRVLPRRDQFGRFASIMVYAPRDRYDSRVRVSIGNFLAEAYGGHVSAFHPFFPEGPLVRVHFIIGAGPLPLDAPEVADLEQGVTDVLRTWTDSLVAALEGTFEESKARALAARYREAFSAGYREAYAPDAAVEDVRTIERLSEARPLGVEGRRRPDTEHGVGLKVWSHGAPIPLSERVPVLENMGFRVVDERTYQVEPEGAPPVWLHDMLLETVDVDGKQGEANKSRVEACFLNVMRRSAENDGYNALVLNAGMAWREVALIRAISRFLRQVRIPYSQDYMWTTLRKHVGIAEQIVELFHARFDPSLDLTAEARREREQAVRAKIEEALEAVASLDEDRIIRRFVNAVQSAVRTSFYQVDTDGQPKATIAIKYESRSLEDMPLPRPLFEIFVYSPRVEGVHLRFGKVARGGIRWSDRPQDFRTEVLGLVKAQQVKNACIVPVGSKGGFVPKHLPSGPREAVQAEGVASYRAFIAALLDVTDNLEGDRVIPPPNVVRHDDDDPYLVVAADKGTATFSDIANEISQSYGFWLDDAFASGGSAGYDHKKMGITARGAWEAVKRHFRELDTDITKEPFTVVGIGDMSGDVFGNGMLREDTIRLVAAFDHRDIFVDPDPDLQASFNERKRLFELPRSSWQDYDKTLISKGGGVFPRSSKDIHLSPEMRTLLGLETEHATPQEVIRAILKMPIDLLWFGGIGTYVRASMETDDMVGDRANDPIRIAAKALRCKVIGEGANLGVTQSGRIEASQHGVKLNSDAIDNSAGVNTSDVEVNIKIALSPPRRDGRLTLDDRNSLLGAMTDEVAALVLRNNYQQTLALSLAERRGLEDLGFQQRLMQTLERQGELDRAVEFLPDDMTLAERRKHNQPLTRPELAVLLAYAKISLYSELLESAVPDDPYLGRELNRYFPPELSKRFPDALGQHRLRREIIATQLANSIINRGGATLAVRIADQTGASPTQIAAAFAMVRGAYDLIALNGAIDTLDAKVSGQLQLDLYAAVQDLLLDRLVWFLRNVDLSKGLAEVIDHYHDGVATVAAALATILPEGAAEALAKRKAELVQGGVPEEIAARVASLPTLAAAADIVLIADRSNRPIIEVAATYFAAAETFQIGSIAAAAQDIPVTDYFDRLARDRALDSIGDAERRLTTAMVGANGVSGPAAVEAWIAPRADDVGRVRTAIDEIASTGLTLSKLTVAASLLGDLVKR